MAAMQDYSDRYGSPSASEIHEREDSRTGQPFDDSYLFDKGFERKTFDYELPDHYLLYQDCRYDDARELPGVERRKKRFLLRTLADVWWGRTLTPEAMKSKREYNRNSDFVFGLPGRRIVYNWPAIVRAGPPSVVYVCQGEKNADDLIGRGLLATTVACNEWTPECAAALTGHDAIILEDNDKKGRELAATANALLSKVAKSTRVVTMQYLWKHLDGKRQLYETDDISDWLEAGGDPKRLTEICSEVPAGGFPAIAPYEFPVERDIAPWDFLYGKHLLRGRGRTHLGTQGHGQELEADRRGAGHGLGQGAGWHQARHQTGRNPAASVDSQPGGPQRRRGQAGDGGQEVPRPDRRRLQEPTLRLGEGEGH
jgi:hypothetical protein